MSNRQTRRKEKPRQEKPREVVKTTFGEELARLRVLRGLSRARLVHRLMDEMEEGDPDYDKVSEAWVRRLENGEAEKLLCRQTIEAYCRALKCTVNERYRVLLYADRNVLTVIGSKPTEVAEVLNFAMACLYAEASEILATLILERKASSLNKRELLEITREAIAIILERTQDRSSQSKTTLTKQSNRIQGVSNEPKRR